MEITIRVEWDMGHRLPNHGGECRHLHGHRYVAEVVVRGAVQGEAGAPDEGMIVDFGVVKGLVRHMLEGQRDHRFLVAESDPLKQMLYDLPGVVVVPWIPTAENIAADFFSQLQAKIYSAFGGDTVRLARLRLYETPTSWVDVT